MARIETGLRCDVYSSTKRGRRDDCTGGGVTGKADEVLLLGDPSDPKLTVEGPFEALGDIPTLRLAWGPTGLLIAVPIGAHDGHRSFGGNWIYTSDSRFPARHPIAVHDRFESGTGGW